MLLMANIPGKSYPTCIFESENIHVNARPALKITLIFVILRATFWVSYREEKVPTENMRNKIKRTKLPQQQIATCREMTKTSSSKLIAKNNLHHKSTNLICRRKKKILAQNSHYRRSLEK